MSEVRIGILLGSDSDFDQVKGAISLLQRFGIPWEIKVLSAHRGPRDVHHYASQAEERGLRVVICCAGMAAHLAGSVASITTLPVIGVPVLGSSLGGTDALYATVQMPTGVPVATMSIGSAGAKNAVIFAAQILAIACPELRQRVREYKEMLDQQVAEKDAIVQKKLAELTKLAELAEGGGVDHG